MADKKISIPEIVAGYTKGTVSEKVNNLLRNTPVGAVDTAIGDNFFGLNHRQLPGAIPINKDNFGLTFFTRPRFNLTDANLRAVRQLMPLLTKEEGSLQRIIRCTLDHELLFPRGQNPEQAITTSPYVDRQQAFIPFLSNNLLEMSGWPDVSPDTFTAPSGVYKETWSFVDGLAQNYTAYDITANFRNTPGDPITLLFFVWMHYMSNVFQGTMTPYPEMIIENEIDYQTRIYRLVLDSSKRKVQKIAACGAAFPLNAPMGQSFNFDATRPLNQANDQISIPFRCIGAMYNDTILMDEFNRTGELFNDHLKDATRNKYYKLVDVSLLPLFNFVGYPRINMATSDLEWWVSNEDYNARLAFMRQTP